MSLALNLPAANRKQRIDDDDDDDDDDHAHDVKKTTESCIANNNEVAKRTSSRLGRSKTISSSRPGSKPADEEDDDSDGDDHNEVCEVCEKGGDLLCCDTCTLVFHLNCLRPKISSIPKGKWSCAHCIADVSI